MYTFNIRRLILAGTGVCWLLPVDTSVGQQVPDSTFKVSVEQPAYTDNHPKVLFDEAHFNVHTMQGTYKAFVDLMNSDGYEFVANTKPFDAKVLDGYDLLITSNARGASQRSEKAAFSDDECDAVRDWVRAGGGLLLVVDHYSRVTLSRTRCGHLLHFANMPLIKRCLSSGMVMSTKLGTEFGES